MLYDLIDVSMPYIEKQMSVFWEDGREGQTFSAPNSVLLWIIKFKCKKVL